MATPVIETTATTPPDRHAEAPASVTAVRTVDSAEILQGSQEVAIAHNGRIYRLRRTRNGKLILT